MDIGCVLRAANLVILSSTQPTTNRTLVCVAGMWASNLATEDPVPFTQARQHWIKDIWTASPSRTVLPEVVPTFGLLQLVRQTPTTMLATVLALGKQEITLAHSWATATIVRVPPNTHLKYSGTLTKRCGMDRTAIPGATAVTSLMRLGLSSSLGVPHRMTSRFAGVVTVVTGPTTPWGPPWWRCMSSEPIPH